MLVFPQIPTNLTCGGSLWMKMVPKNAAEIINKKTTKTEMQVERAFKRLAPPTDAARLRATELKPASAQAVIKRIIAPTFKKTVTNNVKFLGDLEHIYIYYSTFK